MTERTRLHVVPVSMIDRANRQAVEVYTRLEGKAIHAVLRAVDAACGEVICEEEVGIASGEGHARAMLPRPERTRQVRWELRSLSGELLASEEGTWEKPRQWRIYIMISSHTDIGLHNSQYIQRYNSSRFLKQAAALCDQTADRAPENQYRYTVEGTWFFGNYALNHGARAAKKLVREYVKPGKIGVCAGLAGNHTQVYGLEELCRSTYEKGRLLREAGVDSHTLTMIDNNGLSWAMVEPYAEAGYRHIIFSPNQWNPLPSRTWLQETGVEGATWNTEGKGGAARIDMNFDSDLPRIFYWQSAQGGEKILVHSGGNYGHGGVVFGLYPAANGRSMPWITPVRRMENAMAHNLPRIEAKYPYEIWLTASYGDDQAPDLDQVNAMAAWNQQWQWPRFEALGSPDRVLDEFREKYDAVIPTLRGDITGGWYQHPVSAPELLPDKFAADRALPTAEKLAALAALLDPDYLYPAEAFDRAWRALLCNDEHSYGTSGYQGRRVYETWMQHRAWIERAETTARQEADAALRCIASKIQSNDEQVVAFNPAAQARTELLSFEGGQALSDLPSFGYAAIPAAQFTRPQPEIQETETPPVVENAFYQVAFSENGGISSIVDKALGRELLDRTSEYPAGCFIYTEDNHQTFHTPGRARFTVEKDEFSIRVTARMDEACSGAAICQQVTLPAHEKRIELDNRLEHVRGLFNDCRYSRYAYYAFPFDLPGARRLCHLGGCVAEYGRDLTGHGTDVYMAANEWCCAQNGQAGVGLMQLDSELIEFDHIHPDKTDFGHPGEGAQVFCYLANDWLQMHTWGGSAMNFRFRYAITSFAGDYAQAGLPEMAERFAHPPLLTRIGAQAGSLPPRMSFLSSGARLVTLKRAEDGNGLIARLYGAQDDSLNAQGPLSALTIERNTVDERPMQSVSGDAAAFRTLRLGGGQVRLNARSEPETRGLGAARTEIGATYTGLIDAPRAARGELPGRMYMLWGRCMEKDLGCYEVFRGEENGFACTDETLIARVKQEKYCVGRYVDDGLKPNARYFYRVRAVDKSGLPGPLSAEFSGHTKE